MTSTKRSSSALALALLLAACGSSSKRSHGTSSPTTIAASTIVVTSSAFADNARIPDQYTCAGASQIPPLSWTGADPSNKVALIVDDPDAPVSGGFLHWAVVGLPAPGSVPPVPAGAQQLPNGAGQPQWTAPCPPPGKVHHYHFTIHELGGREKTVADIKASKLPSGTLIGTYSR
jgi:Raf kinase inhibitor-like YbhB/YbcL family protein